MKKEEFLVWFIKFSGILEILFGITIIAITPLMDLLELPNFPFWEWSFGLSLAFLGFLLWFSSKDLERYIIIPVSSIVFRFILSGFELYIALTVPQLFPFLLSGAIYDILSPIFTIFLLKRSGYIFKGTLF
ncbi:MAG: hypothetical protein ACTSPA_13595 [Promethearchaeota archaeon]